MNIKLVAQLPIILIACFFLFGGSALLVFEVMNPPAHTAHVFLFAGLAVLGALMLPAIGSVLTAAAKAGIDAASPLIPVFGRRAYDAPTGEPPAPTNPVKFRTGPDDGVL